MRVEWYTGTWHSVDRGQDEPVDITVKPHGSLTWSSTRKSSLSKILKVILSLVDRSNKAEHTINRMTVGVMLQCGSNYDNAATMSGGCLKLTQDAAWI